MKEKERKEPKEVDVSVLFTKEDLPIPKILEFKDKIYGSIKLRRKFEKLVSESIDDLSKKLSSDTKSLARKGIAYWILNRTTEAIGLLEKAWASRETNYFLALAYLDSGLHLKAYDLLKDIYKDDPHQIEFVIPFIDAKIRKGDVEESLEIITKIRKEFRANSDLSYYTGLSWEYLGDYEKAAAEYSHALSVNPAHSRTLFRLAYRADLDGRDEEALALYEKLRKAKPTYINALINLGLLYEDKNEYDRAIECYQTVLEYNPNHPKARLYLKDSLAAKVMYYDEDEEQRQVRLRRVLQTPITDFRLSQRSRTVLDQVKIKTLGDLTKKTEPDLLKSENFGITSLNEIKEILAHRGLTLAADESALEPTTLQPFRKTEGPTRSGDVLNKPLTEFEWSARTRSCFARMRVYTIGDLNNKTEKELLRIKNFGQTSLKEIRQRLTSLSLSLKPGEPD